MGQPFLAVRLHDLCALHVLSHRVTFSLLLPQISHYHPSRMPTLLRTLRERDLFLLFIGSVIGSGVFLTPGLILRQLDG